MIFKKIQLNKILYVILNKQIFKINKKRQKRVAKSTKIKNIKIKVIFLAHWIKQYCRNFIKKMIKSILTKKTKIVTYR